MASSSSPSSSPRILNRIHHPLGFSHTYNFSLYLILCTSLAVFCLSRLRYIDIDNVFCGQPGVALPGECYHLGHGRGKIGITLHLAGILPAGLLVILQFTPAVRHRWVLVHRINGYVIMLLALVSFAGVFMIGNIHFGGSFMTQVITGSAAIIFLSCLGLAIYSIKRLDIEQHRAWMLRAWVSASHVITMRILAELIKRLTSNQPSSYFEARPCAVISYIYSHNSTLVTHLYPSCAAFFTGVSPLQQAVVSANSLSTRPEEISTGFNTTFGPAAFLALLIHCVGVEVYLRLTPGEAERLRRVSWQRQIEAGMVKPEEGCDGKGMGKVGAGGGGIEKHWSFEGEKGVGGERVEDR